MKTEEKATITPESKFNNQKSKMLITSMTLTLVIQQMKTTAMLVLVQTMLVKLITY